MLKYCTGCRIAHLWTEFSPDRWRVDGFSVYCLACQRRRHNDRYRRTGGAAKRRYNRANRDSINAKARAKYASEVAGGRTLGA